MNASHLFRFARWAALPLTALAACATTPPKRKECGFQIWEECTWEGPFLHDEPGCTDIHEPLKGFRNNPDAYSLELKRVSNNQRINGRPTSILEYDHLYFLLGEIIPPCRRNNNMTREDVAKTFDEFGNKNGEFDVTDLLRRQEVLGLDEFGFLRDTLLNYRINLYEGLNASDLEYVAQRYVDNPQNYPFYQSFFSDPLFVQAALKVYDDPRLRKLSGEGLPAETTAPTDQEPSH